MWLRVDVEKMSTTEIYLYVIFVAMKSRIYLIETMIHTRFWLELLGIFQLGLCASLEVLVSRIYLIETMIHTRFWLALLGIFQLVLRVSLAGLVFVEVKK